MKHFRVSEWGRVPIGGSGLTVAQAEGLVGVAKRHPLATAEGRNILTDHRHYIEAKQMVGVLSAPNCSLEILPKMDPEDAPQNAPTVRRQLASLLELALDLKIGRGDQSSISRDAENLLEILIRDFAERLLEQVRRGTPRRYQECEEDLTALRGSLDITRQFTVNAVRPDRLACRFDVLSSDIPLLQIMKAASLFVARFTKLPSTRRLLDELRFALSDISDVPASTLPWDRVHIDRTNQRWDELFRLARLLMGRQFQSTKHLGDAPNGISLLFPMNDLFEAAVANTLKRASASSDICVTSQGGFRNCLGDWHADAAATGRHFQTRPDIIVRQGDRVVAIIDTKWKALGSTTGDPKRGVGQADVYQMMAYSRIYHCDRLMLLYPAAPGSDDGIIHRFGIDGGHEQLAVGTCDVSQPTATLQKSLAHLMSEFLRRDKAVKAA